MPGGGISPLLGRASIAFVWTSATAAAPPNAQFAGPCPTPGRTEERMKDTTFSIRIASGDLDTIKRKAKQTRLSQSDYVTRCCLGRQVVVVEDLKEVLKQQRAIGNNLNQLTVLANMGRVSVASLDETAQALKTISETLREIAERGRWAK